MSNIVKEIALLCAINDVEFRNLEQERKPRVRANLSKKVDVVLINPPYNLGKDLKDDHAAYDKFTSNDVDELSKVVGT